MNGKPRSFSPDGVLTMLLIYTVSNGVACAGRTANRPPSDSPCPAETDASFCTSRESDTSPPVLSGGSPSGALPAGTTTATLRVMTDEIATCNWDTADTAYPAMSNSFATSNGVEHTAALTSLVDGGSYEYFVRCRDGSGNNDPTSYVVSFHVASASLTLQWHDSIQEQSQAPWGFSGFAVEHPIGTEVATDAEGASLTRVADPAGGAGFALRHFANFDTGGARSQAGLYSDVTPAFGEQAKSAEGVWVAQEWYIPERLSCNNDPYCWINLWDWHSVDADRGNRWHTSPGLMLARDGSMRVEWEWGGPASGINESSGYSSIALPVGRWFDIEMHYVWAADKTATLSLWIDGELALEQSGVQTRAASHTIVETYVKFYGSNQGHTPWDPTPSVRYTRNVRVAGERIWR